MSELSAVDIKKIKEEIEHKEKVERPKCLEDLVTARGFGDLSENYEYKAAKQALRRVDSSLRYLKRLLNTARVVEGNAAEGVVGLFDEVDIYYVEDDETETIRLMTSIRENSLNGIISKESPLGRAVMGRRVGERVLVRVNDRISYHVEIRAVRKGSDDESLPIHSF